MKWISVYDSLPPPKERVLVHCRGFIRGMTLRKYIYISFLGRGRKFEIEDGVAWWTLTRVEVTHWMPLPDPPAEELPPRIP